MPIVRLPGGDLRDEIRQPLYDTLTLASAATTADIGPGVVGTSPNDLSNEQYFSAVQGKQKWQSNLRQNNMLETAVSYRLQGMALDAQYMNFNTTGVAGSPILQALLPAVQDFGSVRVRIGEKDYWEGPMAYLMGRIEQNGSIASNFAAPAAAQTGFLYQRAGSTAVQGIILSGRHVVDINPLQSFFAAVTMTIPTTINSASNIAAGSSDVVNLKFSFKGLQRRPVQ